jgi:uncharacterized protein YbaR (Trm112 family)
MAIHPDLIELIRCPKCRGTLTVRAGEGGSSALACVACRLLYPVVDDIPQLLIDEALPLPSTAP